MSILKNEIPILEFDTEKNAVINPTAENLDLSLPEKCVFAFLGEHIDDYALKNNAEKVGEFKTNTKSFPIYVTTYKGEKIALCLAPLGAAASAQMLDWLIGYGVNKIISTGSCGVLDDLPENAFLVPYKALRDEGASYHYAPPSRYILINETALAVIKETLLECGIKHHEVITWTTDGFFRETREMVKYRKEEGCSVVEMEVSALAAVSQFRGAIFGAILFTADSLANIDVYDHRDFGRASWERALSLCLDAVINL